MRFSVHYASGSTEPPTPDALQAKGGGWLIDVPDFESLAALADKLGCGLIFYGQSKEEAERGEPRDLWVYDDYME